MTTNNFDYDAHRIRGNGSDATAWVTQSSLAAAHKKLLLQFIANFPALTFFKDDLALLDYVEQRERVMLPRWFRDQRQTLAFVVPGGHMRVDDFDHLGPRSDSLEQIWYDIDLYGYRNEEQRGLFLDKASSFPIGQWSQTNRSFLALNMADSSDERIYEFANDDLLDNVYDGGLARDSVYPAFDSYAGMLSRIMEIRDIDGNVMRALRPASRSR